MSPGSLRRRVLVGATFWTFGFFLISGAVMMWLVYSGRPHVPDAIHHLFSQTAWMAGVASLFLVAGFVLVRRGLGSLGELRARLADVHAGRERRVRGDFPSETQPLVNDLNALLDAHDANVARAQAKAGDLAHGLKTPLAILAHESERARAAGHADIASAIDQEVGRMRRQIDYHLAHARAAASSAMPGTRTSVDEALAGIRRTVERLHAARGLSIETPERSLYVRAQREDLDEMLGNLLDNACKWARSRVKVDSAVEAGFILVTVDDDGPGLAPAMREAVLTRGVRADQAAPGTGLGLAIVSDLASVYGGAIRLDASPLGGLRAELRLPNG
jgi:signal transduction histidine kinase